jgi:hypothetical protein
MRAERFRGWRIRSPSWRNELIEKDIRQKARQCRAFSFRGRVAPWIAACEILAGQYFYRPHLRRMKQAGLMKAPAGRSDPEGRMTGHAFERAIAAKRRASKAFQGYPVPTNKKNRACIATYRHSGERLLENSFPPHLNVNNR